MPHWVPMCGWSDRPSFLFDMFIRSVAIDGRRPLRFWSGCRREMRLYRVASVLVNDDIFDALVLFHVCAYLIREISVLAEQLGSAFQI